MRTIKLTIEYDGTRYVGWQIQPKGRSVQGEITRAVRRMTGEENHVIGSSRTDAGVHALGQAAHFRTQTMIPPAGFMRGINSMLDKDISVIKAEEADADFHAQKNARSKLYRYMILNSDAPSGLLAFRCWHIRDRLDLKAMQEASKCLIGEHDFKSFQAAGSSAKDAFRKINDITIRKGRYQDHGGAIFIEIQGNGFVYHMVRNIVGTLVKIGKGRAAPSEMEKILNARERKRAGATAPALGLYLAKVTFRD